MLTTLIRYNNHTLIIKKVPAKKGLFHYVPLSDLQEVDRLLLAEIDFEHYRHVQRLFSGLCPKREAVHLCRYVSSHPSALLAALERYNLLKDSAPTRVEVIGDYRLLDGYQIRLERQGDEYFLVEVEKNRQISKSRCLSLREGKGRLLKTVENIETYESTQFYIYKEVRL